MEEDQVENLAQLQLERTALDVLEPLVNETSVPRRIHGLRDVVVPALRAEGSR